MIEKLLNNIKKNTRSICIRASLHPNSGGIVYKYVNGEWCPYSGNGWLIGKRIKKRNSTGSEFLFFTKDDTALQKGLDQISNMYPVTKDFFEFWFFNVDGQLSIALKSPEMKTTMINEQQFKTYTT